MLKISWGTKIATLYIGFVGLIILMVSMSMRQRVDLVSEDYYNRELAYQDKINEIKHEAGNDILLFGSPTATHSLIQLNLMDGYWLFVNPIILGQGIPLFTDIKAKIKLKLLTTRQFACGVTELNYTVDRQ